MQGGRNGKHVLTCVILFSTQISCKSQEFGLVIHNTSQTCTDMCYRANCSIWTPFAYKYGKNRGHLMDCKTTLQADMLTETLIWIKFSKHKNVLQVLLLLHSIPKSIRVSQCTS